MVSQTDLLLQQGIPGAEAVTNSCKSHPDMKLSPGTAKHAVWTAQLKVDDTLIEDTKYN